jgi:predicted permease
MLRSLDALLAVDPGIKPERVVAFRANPPAGRYPDGMAYRDYYARISAQVAAVPGIDSVGAINLLPGASGNWSFPTFPEGVDVAEGTAVPSVNFRATRIGYFQTVGVPLIAGRFFDESDSSETEDVALVNEAFVREFWPDDPPLGRTVRLFSSTGDPARVVGVVGDVRQHSRSQPARPEVYFTHSQVPWNEMSMWLVARVTSGDPLDQAAAIRAAVWAVDPDVPIANMQNLSTRMARSTRSTRFLALLLSSFGAIALALGALGIFGVTSHTVGRRVPEFGVRVALGSSRAGILGAALQRSLRPVGLGLLVGVGGALATSGLLESVLYGVEATDPATLAAVVAILASIATLAAVVPAWRASRVDPVRVLNAD